MSYIRLSRSRLRAMLSGLAALALSAAPAFAVGSPAGMVMAVTGPTSPSLLAMSEIPAQTPVALGPGVSMTFILYSTCKLVTVSGGTLTLSGAAFTTSGQVVNQEDTECPGRFDLNEPAVGAGEVPGVVRFRGVAQPPAGRTSPLAMTASAQIVLSGARADQVNSAVLIPAGGAAQPLIRYNLYFRRAIAPSGAPAVAPGGRYTLRLTLAGASAPLDIPIVGSSGGATFVVVRVN